MPVIGGGRVSDGYIVSPSTKADVVQQLRTQSDLVVWAFGDSPIDIPMLMEVDQAIVVVGSEATRSASMDAALIKITKGSLSWFRQVLLPSTSGPRLDPITLPTACLDERLLDELCSSTPRNAEVLHATGKKAAQVLATAMRDASVSGPALREAHGRVGRYLAVEFLPEVIGLEEYEIQHVQGNTTTGHRLRSEGATGIVALMRGGEPMAFGINAIYPTARFMHASSASDLKLHHLKPLETFILVDSVINSGKSIIEFIEHIQTLDDSVQIVLVAGVVQRQGLHREHVFCGMLRRLGIPLVALRLSENKFTGSKGTDTGNRLFNTTNLA